MVQSLKNGLITAFSIGLLFILLSCSVLSGSTGNNEITQTKITLENFTKTSTVMPGNTALPSTTSSLTETPTPIPSPTATLHPMSIQALREMSFPGSEISLENELEPGANYRRYYASYRSEGFKIYGLLTIPNGETPSDGWPAIIFNHGYIPPDVYRTTERYIAYVDWLARSQYIVFRIDYRGHDQSEGQASGAYGDPGYVIDVLNAVSSIKQFPQANPEKIGMWGHSMGGYLTLRAMVTRPDIKAGVIWAGVVASYPDMLNLWRRNNPNPAPTAPSFARRWRQIWVEQYGSPEENPEFWQSVSSNSYLSDISGPLQLHHGTLDEDVPLVFSEILTQELVNENKIVEFYKYEGDNHNLSNYFSTAMTRTIEFFDRYLK
ncbi:MAG: alpha/beta hydrolase family protein [Anaerolineaceae bacterium]